MTPLTITLINVQPFPEYYEPPAGEDSPASSRIQEKVSQQLIFMLEWLQWSFPDFVESFSLQANMAMEEKGLCWRKKTEQWVQVFITSEEAEQGVNPLEISKGMRSYRFDFPQHLETDSQSTG